MTWLQQRTDLKSGWQSKFPNGTKKFKAKKQQRKHLHVNELNHLKNYLKQICLECLQDKQITCIKAKKTVRKCYDQLYAYTFDNLDESD